MPGKHSPDHNASASSLDRSGNGCRVVPFRGFTPYTPTSICPMEHKTRFIRKRYLSPLSGRPAALLACKF
ncbi:hypothetical protein TNCV_2129531 [Trichonephila clavipes]|nr:hypothetical protein TNCV_2129531 [Trichonephila clavipes]